MRKNGLTHWLQRAVTATLLVGGIGLSLTETATAQTPPPPVLSPVSEFSTTASSANTAEARLAAEYNRLLDECCNGKCASTGCASGCNDGCGWCNLGEPLSINDLFADECGNSWLGDISVGGWTQFGYHTKNNGMFNNHRDNLNLHQQWFYAEKVANSECGELDWGFRVDAMYGVDGADTQAFGNPGGRWDNSADWDHGIYGWALPQAYAELAMGDWSVKLGHFYTLVGYETVTAPDNFFYSHSYTMYNSEPFTHTGALFTYGLSDSIELYGGWTLGWDTGFDQNNNGSSFLGGASWSANDDVTFTYINTVGNFGARGDGYSHSLVLDMALTDKLNYVLQSDVFNSDVGNDHQVGINNFAFYEINDCLSVGSRVEWWKSAGTSHYAATFGANVRPHANVVFRPEVRHDWAPGGNSIGPDNDFTTFGIDMILTY